jgi:hypothetical protein
MSMSSNYADLSVDQIDEIQKRAGELHFLAYDQARRAGIGAISALRMADGVVAQFSDEQRRAWLLLDHDAFWTSVAFTLNVPQTEGMTA